MTPTEQAVTEIWAEILRRDRVGLEEDFFALGGDSLMAVRMAMKVFERLGVEPPLGQLTENRTARAFARSIDELVTGEEEEGAI